MNLLRRPQGAAAVMVLAIVISSSVSAVASINKQAAAVRDEFYKGQYGDNMSIYEDLVDKTEDAVSLVALATKGPYVDASDQHIKAIIEDTNTIKADGTASALYAASASLDENVTWLMTALEAKVAANATDAKMLTKYSALYKSEIQTIASDPYNSLVKAFKDETGGFPGSLFGRLATDVTYFK